MFDYTSYDAVSDDTLAAAMYDAMHIKPDCIDFNIDKQDAYMRRGSSSWYHVTLSSCDCRSFSVTNARKVPCKHMFRLAYELGCQVNFPKFDPGSEYDPASDLETLHQHWVDGKITFEAYYTCRAALEKSARAAKRARKISGTAAGMRR